MSDQLAGHIVLVVEDEMMVAWLLEDTLADFGCTVVGPVGTVSQALAMIEDEPIDLAVLDVNLDGQMSYPVADALARHGVPFCFSTGYERDRLDAKYRHFPILAKSFQPAELRLALTSLLVSASRPFGKTA